MRRPIRLALGVAALLCATASWPAVASTDGAADKKALLDRGMSEKGNRDFDAAIADFGRAIAADPKWALAYQFRGSAYAAKAESTDDPAATADLLGKAIADYDSAIRLGEATARTFTLRGVALSGTGDLKAAVADFDRALKLDASFTLAKRMRDYVLDQQRDQDRAIAIDGDLLRFQPRNVDLLLSRAALLAQAGRRDEARHDLDQVLEIDPKNEGARAQRAALGRADAKDPGAAHP